MRSPDQRGRLVVLAGPSGVGKSSVVGRLRELLPDLWFSVSATTRQPRPGEVDGRDYHFVGPDRFDEMIEHGDLLEWAEIHGGTHRSGTPRQPVEDRVASGRPALVELDLQGARSLRAVLPEALLVFVAPPSWEVLVERLVGRGTESPEVVERRLATARAELAARSEFDVVVVNEDVNSAAERLLALLTGPDPRAGHRNTADASDHGP
ncbi:guanylate kinase [Actinoalloteichus sp. AHMU CJ021]|uniref:Guanylate kinase n=1 Tax=Actinoalloteichus caeruleus DSM 43889 TaxID=1120930 RepID=A0ABT1JG21_ACTCY|nr:guanylate kinase [Actinoalloteichus caeruleus]AUS77551.1 guanylate kinase [Actinoalloteichus sp. AHMU CJ021]MCP2331431.1 guanylate kinase [Actinoalloteichus caeruleus DSM 43889]